ncbi:Crp/Fnr family transcriptional regulator [Sphingomonas sp. HDW15A]|uniref:Crp/Fnr family transcriptional regulator n=1 Tax=Sphingomonas sp. HDW15A TaxID=2714942 RepID=UPI00140DCC34|nr:Crp/Fnr family transcriptional regulator [Sphingomonas sp. HDW15A]QIK95530.1 Crp/Fnr family transcriptional regulator [Sphingomonas sp. HDW15A]
MMSARQSPALLPFLQKLERGCTFTGEERDAILALPFTPMQIEANRDFLREGQPVDCSTFVFSGMVGAFKQDRSGRRQVVSIYIPGDMVDLHSVPVPETAAALQSLVATTVLHVPHPALRDIAARYPKIAFAFWRQSVLDAAILMEWVMNLGQRNARCRTAHFLCELAYRAHRRTPADGSRIPYGVTQFALADILGLTPVHVNRTLQLLRSEGLIDTIDRSIHRILDWKGLVKAGDFHPGYLKLDEEAMTGWSCHPQVALAN